MSKVCILTDNTVQFPIPAFAGRNLVHVLPLHITKNGTMYSGSEGVRSTDLPAQLENREQVQALPPSVAEFEKMYRSLGRTYDEIVTILHADQLTKTYAHAQAAAKNIQGRVKIYVIDSGTVATGLGLVVQTASAAAEEGKSGEEIEDMLRSLLPRVYTIFCVQGLSYLEHTRYLQHPQAVLGEYLKILQLFVLDNGQLMPTQKARNYRHLVDLMHEFVTEFSGLEHIAFLQGIPSFENETRALRERLNEDYPDTPISEHTINTPLAAVLGPRSLGVFMLQGEGY